MTCDFLHHVLSAHHAKLLSSGQTQDSKDQLDAASYKICEMFTKESCEIFCSFTNRCKNLRHGQQPVLSHYQFE